MIERLAIFGATGDLTARYLLPGLAALHHDKRIGAAWSFGSASSVVPSSCQLAERVYSSVMFSVGIRPGS